MKEELEKSEQEKKIQELKTKQEMYRHSMSHILAKAVCELYPGTKLAIGPAIDNGFYYDFDLSKAISDADFVVIETKMNEILAKNEDFRRIEVSKSEALKLFKDQPYKLELISELPADEKITVYHTGDDFYDLCRGPHVESTKFLRGFAYKINRISGAYWRGSEKNKMLTRIYAYGFLDKAELKEHIAKIEDALKRDHNKIGRELEYFTTVDCIGKGLPVMLPKGAKTIQLMQRWIEDEEEKRGYLLTKTPLMSKSDLLKISGHWDHYKENMYVIGDEEKDKEVYGLRPMTCPFQYQVFLNRARSYKDLPMRLGETSTLFRKEASGECHGLIRLRQFTISEAHIMCTPVQLEEEFKGCLDLAKSCLTTLGLIDDITFRFSKWDESNREKYIGSKEQWEQVQNEMRKILNDLQVDFYEADGEAAFYGPKLDMQIKNVHGKEDTIVTIQIDFQIAEKFGMEYTDTDGGKKNPYIIHRTSIGCYERTLAYLLEKYAGALPTWLSPNQVKIITVSENNVDYAKKIAEQLRKNKIRTECDFDNESVGKKIRDAVLEKNPYILILGDKENSDGTVAVRKRGGKDTITMSYVEFEQELLNKIDTKVID